RVRNVTGVQTCALPISKMQSPESPESFFSSLTTYRNLFEEALSYTFSFHNHHHHFIHGSCFHHNLRIIFQIKLFLPSQAAITIRSEERRVGKELSTQRR